MKIVKLTIQINEVWDRYVNCLINDEQMNLILVYYTDTGVTDFSEENNLATTILKNKHQFEKIICSALKGKMHVGQIINAVFIEDFNFLDEADFNHFIRVDRRKGNLEITKSETSLTNIPRIYADGSYACETRQGGYGGFIEMPGGKQQLFQQSFNNGSSNLMELLAVTNGLELLRHETKIQINTDSRFVIRGFAQWTHFWRHNNWQTAYGCKVKFADSWQKIDRLCEDKLIELHWIKGHSGHEAQDYCHNVARLMAVSPKRN